MINLIQRHMRFRNCVQANVQLHIHYSSSERVSNVCLFKSKRTVALSFRNAYDRGQRCADEQASVDSRRTAKASGTYVTVKYISSWIHLIDLHNALQIIPDPTERVIPTLHKRLGYNCLSVTFFDSWKSCSKIQKRMCLYLEVRRRRRLDRHGRP